MLLTITSGFAEIEWSIHKIKMKLEVEEMGGRKIPQKF